MPLCLALLTKPAALKCMRKEVEIVNKLGCTRDRRRSLSGA